MKTVYTFMPETGYELPPEDTLLVLCSACEYPLNLLDVSRKCSFDSMDWEKLFKAACQHRVLSMLASSLNREGFVESVPGVVRVKLAIAMQHEHSVYTKQMDEVARISSHFLDKGQRMCFMKGVALTQTTYQREPTAKRFGDFDILAPSDQCEDVAAILINELGYTWENDDPGVQVLHKQLVQHLVPLTRKGMFPIDVHHRLSQKYDSWSANTDRILSNVDYAWYKETKIPITSLEDTVITLCLHLYQHEYRELRYRLKHHADIFNTLFCYKDTISWDKILKYAREDGIEFPIAYALYYTNLVYREVIGLDVVPGGLLEEIAPPGFERQRNGMTHRHLHSDRVFGYWNRDYGRWNRCSWSGHYFQRLFGDENLTLLRFFYTYFRSVGESQLEELCNEMGLEYRGRYYSI